MYPMKPSVLTFIAICAAALTQAQTPKPEWAKAIGGSGNDRANSISADNKGNIIVAGRFQSNTISLDHLTLTKSPQDAEAASDIFIIKLDKNGKALWGITAGGFGDDHALSCTTDKKGNIYVVGYFESETLAFGDIVLKNNNFTAGKEGVRYNSDMWVAKFNPEGKCLWARNAGGLDGNGHYSKIALDKEYNVIVGGIAGGEMHFGNGVSLIAEIIGMYIAKYGNDGELLWIGSAQPGECQGVGVDNENNPITGGYFSEYTTFGDIPLTSIGNTDAYLVKYNPNGEVMWARRFGGEGGEIASCGADPYGNVYLGGLYFSPTIETETDTLINKGSINSFLAKYDKDGQLLWARSVGGNNGDGPATATREFHVDRMGNAYCTGSNWSDFEFAGSPIRNVAGSEDILLLKYDRDGNEIWGVDYGGAGRNAGRGIATDAKGGIYLTGSFEEPELKIGHLTLTNSGSSDIFIIKFTEKKK
jgi:hypothetical protein